MKIFNFISKLRINRFVAIDHKFFFHIAIFLVSFNCNLSFSQDVEGEKNILQFQSVQPLIKPVVRFTAEQFFAPTTNLNLRSQWPEKLTIQPLEDEMSLEQMADQLKGSWKIVHHCEGAIISQEAFRHASLLDGVFNPYVILDFNLDQYLVNRYFVLPSEQGFASQNIIERRVLNISKIHFNSTWLYPLKITFEQYPQVDYRFVRIIETNEVLIETNQSRATDQENFICPGNKFPQVLLIPFDYLLS